MNGAIQVWSSDDWEAFSLGLLQSRHGALNVHKIPAAHKGDFGIDYYCTSDAVAYQCYAAQEPIDIATRAERQKDKITTDVGKIVANAHPVSKLFLSKPVKHWVLLVPLHDSKEVNLHCANKTLQTRKLNCSHLDVLFEIGIHDQGSFPTQAVSAGMASLATVTLDVPCPSEQELNAWQAGSGDLLVNATRKLSKRADKKAIQEVVGEATKCFLQGNSILDALRSGSPDMHERIVVAISARARLLTLGGPPSGPTPHSILSAEIIHLNTAIKTAAPNLSDNLVEQISMGTVCEWIMRCPLDFTIDAA